MMGVGVFEALIVIPLAVLTAAVPLGTLIFVILIYSKVKRMEELLRRGSVT